MKENNLMTSDWKVLIILDACRYDYFEKHYKKFFKGKLEKRLSRTTDTMEWLVETFEGNYEDTVYISANPFITPKMEVNAFGLKFYAKDKFYKVINVWDTEWDEELCMIKPIDVNRRFLEALSSYPDKRFIIHYLQPHYPYIELSMEDKKSRIPRKPLNRRFKRVGEFLNSIGLNVRTIKRLLNRPSDQMGYIINKYGVGRLKEEYEKNLLSVLEHITMLLPNIKGKVVITSDHGELLGEHGKFGHAGYKNYKELAEIPYLECTIK